MIMSVKIRHKNSKSNFRSTISYCFSLLKEFTEKKNLIIDGVIPVLTVVRSRTGDEIMIDLQFQQTVVQILIYIQKEIRFPQSTINAKSPFCNLST